jgi:hypothetical protein
MAGVLAVGLAEGPVEHPITCHNSRVLICGSHHQKGTPVRSVGRVVLKSETIACNIPRLLDSDRTHKRAMLHAVLPQSIKCYDDP